MGYVILALVAALVAVILVRTALFRPKAQPAISNEAVTFDKDAAISALAELVKCKTVSYNDPQLENDEDFQKLIGKLPALYPNVFHELRIEYNRYHRQGYVGKQFRKTVNTYPRKDSHFKTCFAQAQQTIVLSKEIK